MMAKMNPTILKNMESVNYTMDAGVFEDGTNAKSTPGLPIHTYLRLSKIGGERREMQEAQTMWIRRNKHVIKLKSIMNRVKRDSGRGSDRSHH